MRIAPRTMLCGTAYRVHPNDAGARFVELRELCAATGDKAPLATAMAGLVMDPAYRGRIREASKLASEAMALIESLGDPNLTVGLSFPALYAKFESGEWPDVLGWSQTVIDLADGDPFKGNFIFGSPLALALASRGTARYCLGHPGWREDLRHGLDIARGADPLTYAGVAALGYFPGISNGALAADDRAVREIEDALGIAERAGNDMAPAFATMALGVALAHRHAVAERDRGLTLMVEVSDVFARKVHNLGDRPLVESREETVRLVAHVCRVQATARRRRTHERDELAGSGVHPRRVDEAGGKPERASLHRRIHLVDHHGELAGGRQASVGAKHGPSDRPLPDQERLDHHQRRHRGEDRRLPRDRNPALLDGVADLLLGRLFCPALLVGCFCHACSAVSERPAHPPVRG